jgi:hypothetical protein
MCRLLSEAPVSVEEHFATIAGRILADVATGQPVRDPREGEPMSDHILAEARRHHAAVCRDYNPNVTQEQIDFYWAGLGDTSQNSYLRSAQRRLNEGATR